MERFLSKQEINEIKNTLPDWNEYTSPIEKVLSAIMFGAKVYLKQNEIDEKSFMNEGDKNDCIYSTIPINLFDFAKDYLLYYGISQGDVSNDGQSIRLWVPLKAYYRLLGFMECWIFWNGKITRK